MRLFLSCAILILFFSEQLVSAKKESSYTTYMRKMKQASATTETKKWAALVPKGTIEATKQDQSADCDRVLVDQFHDLNDAAMGPPNGWYDKAGIPNVNGRPAYKRIKGASPDEQALHDYQLQWNPSSSANSGSGAWEIVDLSDDTVIAYTGADVATAATITNAAMPWSYLTGTEYTETEDVVVQCNTRCYVAVSGKDVIIPMADGSFLDLTYSDVYEYWSWHIGYPTYRSQGRIDQYRLKYLYYDSSVVGWNLQWYMALDDKFEVTDHNTVGTIISQAATPDLIGDGGDNPWNFWDAQHSIGFEQEGMMCVCLDQTCASLAQLAELTCNPASGQTSTSGVLGDNQWRFDVVCKSTPCETSECCAPSCKSGWPSCQTPGLHLNPKAVDLPCNGGTCSDEICCVGPVCSSISTTGNCAAGNKRINHADSSFCTTADDPCPKDCCVPQIVQTVGITEVTVEKGKELEQQSNFSGISVGDACPSIYAIALGAKDLPAPQCCNETCVLLDDMGDAGMDRMTVTLIDTSLASDFDLKLPTITSDYQYATKIIDIKGFTRNGESKSNPFLLYVCGRTIAGKFILHVLSSEEPVDFLTLEGTRLDFTGPQGGLSNSDCSSWFYVVVPKAPITLVGTSDKVPPVDCEWSWEDTSPCSLSCNGGTKNQVYRISTYPFGTGKLCDFVDGTTQTAICNEQPCTCGNGVVDEGEECDPGFANADQNPCCVGCRVQVAGSVCRASTGPCDAEEVCDGTALTCPADEKLKGIKCRDAPGVCGFAAYCDGANAECPAGAFRHNHHICRIPDDECDLPERCSGHDYDCPANAFKPEGTFCGGPQSEHRCLRGVCNAILTPHAPERVDWMKWEGKAYTGPAVAGAVEHHGEKDAHPHIHRHPFP